MAVSISSSPKEVASIPHRQHVLLKEKHRICLLLDKEIASYENSGKKFTSFLTVISHVATVAIFATLILGPTLPTLSITFSGMTWFFNATPFFFVIFKMGINYWIIVRKEDQKARQTLRQILDTNKLEPFDHKIFDRPDDRLVSDSIDASKAPKNRLFERNVGRVVQTNDLEINLATLNLVACETISTIPSFDGTKTRLAREKASLEKQSANQMLFGRVKSYETKKQEIIEEALQDTTVAKLKKEKTTFTLKQKVQVLKRQFSSLEAEEKEFLAWLNYMRESDLSKAPPCPEPTSYAYRKILEPCIIAYRLKRLAYQFNHKEKSKDAFIAGLRDLREKKEAYLKAFGKVETIQPISSLIDELVGIFNSDVEVGDWKAFDEVIKSTLESLQKIDPPQSQKIDQIRHFISQLQDANLESVYKGQQSLVSFFKNDLEPVLVGYQLHLMMEKIQETSDFFFNDSTDKRGFIYTQIKKNLETWSLYSKQLKTRLEGIETSHANALKDVLVDIPQEKEAFQKWLQTVNKALETIGFAKGPGFLFQEIFQDLFILESNGAITESNALFETVLLNQMQKALQEANQQTRFLDLQKEIHNFSRRFSQYDTEYEKAKQLYDKLSFLEDSEKQFSDYVQLKKEITGLVERLSLSSEEIANLPTNQSYLYLFRKEVEPRLIALEIYKLITHDPGLFGTPLRLTNERANTFLERVKAYEAEWGSTSQTLALKDLLEGYDETKVTHSELEKAIEFLKTPYFLDTVLLSDDKDPIKINDFFIAYVRSQLDILKNQAHRMLREAKVDEKLTYQGTLIDWKNEHPELRLHKLESKLKQLKTESKYSQFTSLYDEAVASFEALKDTYNSLSTLPLTEQKTSYETFLKDLKIFEEKTLPHLSNKIEKLTFKEKVGILGNKIASKFKSEKINKFPIPDQVEHPYFRRVRAEQIHVHDLLHKVDKSILNMYKLKHLGLDAVVVSIFLIAQSIFHSNPWISLAVANGSFILSCINQLVDHYLKALQKKKKSYKAYETRINDSARFELPGDRPLLKKLYSSQWSYKGQTYAVDVDSTRHTEGYLAVHSKQKIAVELPKEITKKIPIDQAKVKTKEELLKSKKKFAKKVHTISSKTTFIRKSEEQIRIQERLTKQEKAEIKKALIESLHQERKELKSFLEERHKALFGQPQPNKPVEGVLYASAFERLDAIENELREEEINFRVDSILAKRRLMQKSSQPSPYTEKYKKWLEDKLSIERQQEGCLRDLTFYKQKCEELKHQRALLEEKKALTTQIDPKIHLIEKNLATLERQRLFLSQELKSHLAKAPKSPEPNSAAILSEEKKQLREQENRYCFLTHELEKVKNALKVNSKKSLSLMLRQLQLNEAIGKAEEACKKINAPINEIKNNLEAYIEHIEKKKGSLSKEVTHFVGLLQKQKDLKASLDKSEAQSTKLEADKKYYKAEMEKSTASPLFKLHVQYDILSKKLSSSHEKGDKLSQDLLELQKELKELDKKVLESNAVFNSRQTDLQALIEKAKKEIDLWKRSHQVILDKMQKIATQQKEIKDQLFILSDQPFIPSEMERLSLIDSSFFD